MSAKSRLARQRVLTKMFDQSRFGLFYLIYEPKAVLLLASPSEVRGTVFGHVDAPDSAMAIVCIRQTRCDDVRILQAKSFVEKSLELFWDYLVFVRYHLGLHLTFSLSLFVGVEAEREEE